MHYERAHTYGLRDQDKQRSLNYDRIKDNAKALHEYAQTKIRLAASLSRRDLATKRRMTRDGIELLRRAIQLSDDSIRNAWCYYDLARALDWLKAPASDVLQAYQQAIELQPHEERFQAALQAWRRGKH